MKRQRLTRGVFGLAIVLIVCAILLAMTSGIAVERFGIRIGFRDPIPVLSAAALALVFYLLLASGVRLTSLARAVTRVREPWVVVGLSLVTVAIGAKYCAPVAGGADAYGYVSQADRWLEGPLRMPEPWLANVPWPAAEWTFCPLGYLPAHDATEKWTLVPMYSPGLPLLMAGAKLFFGQCAMFAIVPLSGGLLVLMTYLIAIRLGVHRAGLIGAWLVATSPTVLYMLAWPMSDVPVAAALATAFYFLVGPGPRNAALAGLAVSLGILIRPNLFFAAPVLGSYFVIEAVRGGRSQLRERAVQALVFGLGALPGIVGTALVNHHLHGSAFRSGYGTMGDVLAFSNVPANLTRYGAWLLETQTPIVLAGVGALLVPRQVLWPGLVARAAPWVMAAFVASVFGMYLMYVVFDAWWFMRFLLPAWPFLMIATGSVVASALPVVGRAGRLAVAFAILAIGANGYYEASKRSAFDLWKEGKKYVAAAELVKSHTPPKAVVMAMQHSGSVRYYAGRLTLRYDSLDPAWLDRAVGWLSERGVRTYLMGDDWEIAMFKERFATQTTTARLADPPLFDYAGANRILLYQLTSARAPDAAVDIVTEAFDGFPCLSPVPLSNPLESATK